MTEEEWNELSPEKRAALESQLRKVKSMRVDYGASGDPYGQSGQQFGAAPGPQGSPDEDMPQIRAADYKGSQLLTTKAPPEAASVAGLPNGMAPVAEGSLYGGFGSAPIAVPAGEGLTAAAAADAGMTTTAVPVAAAGGEAGSGALAAAGPWAALAAVIAGNEYDARKHGRRSESASTYAGDLLSGAVAGQDMQYHGKKIGGPVGKATEFAGKLTEKGLAPWKLKGKDFKPWEWFS